MTSQAFFPKKDCLFSDVKLKCRKTSYTEVPLSIIRQNIILVSQWLYLELLHIGT